jgi:glycosyltransferase involved in cell wall biosynthesis
VVAPAIGRYLNVRWFAFAIVTVGVVLPVHNGEEYIGDAIESVLAQTHKDLDLVVVDDNSTDTTAAVVREYEDSRITLLQNEENRGVAMSRNRGVDAVSGDLLAFIDHDDVWRPEKLEQHLKRHRDGGSDVVYSDIEHISANGEPLATSESHDPDPSSEALVRQFLFYGGGMITTMSSVTVCREAWETIGGEEGALEISGDVDLYLRLAGEYTFERVPEPLVKKRQHEENISDDHEQIYRDHKLILERALDRYDFLSHEEVSSKRARMAYRRATGELAVGESRQALRFARESLAHEFAPKPVAVAMLAAVDIASGPLSLGRRLLSIRSDGES